MKKTILWIIIIVLLLALAYYGYMILSREYSTDNDSDTVSQEADPPISQSANFSDFTVYDNEGKQINLSDIAAESKPILINFWTTWCGYCKQEMPDFNTLYKQYKDEISFMMIDVNGNGNDNAEDAKKYVEEQGYEFPVYFDTDLSATMAYGINSFPVTVAIDSNGSVIYSSPGMLQMNQLQSIIDSLLK